MQFTLSKDSALQRQGTATKIDYEDDFNTYLKYLTVSCSENKASVKEIFHIWNGYFFPSKAKPTTVGLAPSQMVNEVFVALGDDNDDNTP